MILPFIQGDVTDTQAKGNWELIEPIMLRELHRLFMISSKLFNRG
jgi:hypothetical protein